MVDVVRAQHAAREFLEIVVLFVGGVVGADDAELAAARLHFLKLAGEGLERLGPRDRFEFAVNAQERRLQAVRVTGKVETVAPLDTKKLAIDAGAVAIVAADDLVVADAQRGLAAVGAMRANGAHVLHLPGPRLIAIGTASERADGADVNAHAALVALEMVAGVGRDLA